MKIALIKQLNEKLPYWVKRPFSSMIRKKLITNQIFLMQYKSLVRADSMSESEKLQEQMQQLQRTVKHAYMHTIFYRQQWKDLNVKPEDIRSLEDLKKLLPILSKKDLDKHYIELQADDIADSYEVNTGGTTGKPIRVMMERNAIYREWAFIYHYWAKYGYDYQTSKLATLRGVNMGKQMFQINPLYQEIRLNVFLMNRVNIRQYVQRIEKYGADFLYGYPSAVYNFCHMAREAGIVLKGKFKAALLISENLYSFQEEEITKTCACPIAIFYGHSERAVFAERYGTGYTFHPFYGVTEISSRNTPIVTGFINGKMPLIRYEVDDQVVMTDDIVEIIGHRGKEVLYGAKGEEISVAAINFHDRTFDYVEGYQFLQTEPGYCVLNVILPDDKLSDIRLQRIQKSVNRKIGMAVECEVRQVTKLQLTERGKYQMVLQKCQI